MQGLSVIPGAICRLAQDFVAEKAAIGDVLVDPGQALVNHAAGAKVHVAYFRITHLAIRQADFQAGGVDKRMGAGCQQLVPDRCIGLADGIVCRAVTVTLAIEYQQQGGASGISHGKSRESG